MAMATKPMPSVSSGMSKLKRATPEFTSVPTRPSSRPSTIMPNRLEQRARGQHHGADQAQHHQREVLGRAELEGHFGQRRRKGRQDQRAHAAGKERAQAGRRQRRPGPALARHLVAVDHGHHRRRFARQVDQNGGGRAAVLRAVVDAGQHDQRGHRRQRIGGWQQHGDGGHRADAGQHADQRAQQAADEGVHQVLA
jgi:hypothetical protein